MSERFKRVLDEASKRVGEWPEWKKSDALKMSEQALESKRADSKESDSDQTNADDDGE